MSKLVLLGGGAAIAIYLVYSRKQAFFDEKNTDFRDGFTAGFFTPGPFTIMALAGYIAWSS
jgi:hypothetical protein